MAQDERGIVYLDGDEAIEVSETQETANIPSGDDVFKQLEELKRRLK
jgi:hypothetical protein